MSDNTVNDDVNAELIPGTYIKDNLKVHWDTFSLNLLPYHSWAIGNVDQQDTSDIYRLNHQ